MNETQKLFYTDPYQRAFCATVLACAPCGTDFCVALDATAFYPEGGGQPADRGALGGTCVKDVQEKDGVVWHTVTAPLCVGETIQGNIDWGRRFDLMQQHTGEHIVSGVIYGLFGWENVGFHIGQDVVTVDFNGVISVDDLQKVEQAANWVVWKNTPVEISYPGPEALRALTYRSKKELSGPVRIVSVTGGADVCACCGVHVAHSAEVGLIKLLSAQAYKGGTRLTMVSGLRALRDYKIKQENTVAIAHMLSVKPNEAAAGVQRLAKENAALAARMVALENRLFSTAAQTQAGCAYALVFENDLAPDSLRRLCLALCETCGGICAAFSGEGQNYYYAVGAAHEDVRPFIKQMNAALGGRGGGKPGLVQGAVAAAQEEIERFFAKTLAAGAEQ